MTDKTVGVIGCLGVVVLAAAVAALLGLGALARVVDVEEPRPQAVPPHEEPPPPHSEPEIGLEPVRPFNVRTAAPPREATPPASPELTLEPVRPFTVRTAAPPRQGTPAPLAVPPMPVPMEREPEPFLPHPGEWRLFARHDDGARYRMKYGFVDYGGRRHQVTCSIDREAVARASRAFGLDRAELTAEIAPALQAAVDREIAKRGLTSHVRVAVQPDGGWRFTSTGDGAGDEVQAFEAWLRGDYHALLARLQTAAYARRGLLLRDRTISVDHNAVARAATADLRECYDALAAAEGAASERSFLGLLVAFFQELKYELPPSNDGPRDILGFWVPARVVADGKGDCDSKAVAFAALWRRRASRVLVVRVPDHALLGVEARPGPGERVVRVGNRYYVLCEVAGPRKLPPGSTDVSGSFEFVSIDPE